jgi:hypothetical protein
MTQGISNINYCAAVEDETNYEAVIRDFDASYTIYDAYTVIARSSFRDFVDENVYDLLSMTYAKERWQEPDKNITVEQVRLLIATKGGWMNRFAIRKAKNLDSPSPIYYISYIWPDNYGFVEATEKMINLEVGSLLDMYGHPNSQYLYPKGVDYKDRSLTPGTREIRPYQEYIVVKPFEVKSGNVQPWFGVGVGAGIQYYLRDHNIKYYLENGYLAEGTVLPVKSNKNEIISFSLDQQTKLADINTTGHTVSIEVSSETDISNLSPTIEVSPKATINPSSNVAHDFTNPLVYTVVSEDGTSQEWTVTVTSAPLVNAEKPSITNNLADITCQVGDNVSLDLAATVSDGGKITYEWYSVDDKNKSNPKTLTQATASYSVNTESVGTHYYYCEVTNSNNSVNGSNISKVDSSVSEVIIEKSSSTHESLETKAAIELESYGIIANSANGFNEKSPLLRETYICIISKLHGLSDEAEAYPNPSTFSDVPKDSWYSPYVAFAEHKGWITSSGSGDTFRPKDPLNASEFNMMLLQVLGYKVDISDIDTKVAELDIDVSFVDESQVLRGEAFIAIEKVLNTPKKGDTEVLGLVLGLPNFTSKPSSSKSIVSYDLVELTQTGDIAHNNVQYKTSNNVLNALPKEILVKLEDGSTASIGVNWTDTDGYNSKESGKYLFTASWVQLPNNLDNDDNVSAPICNIEVVKGIVTETTPSSGSKASSSHSSSKSSSKKNSSKKEPKTTTEKANDEIKKAKANKSGIISVNVKAKATRKGKADFKLPSKFISNNNQVRLTVENKDLQVTLNNDMFTKKEKEVELIMEPAKTELLGLSEKDKEKIKDMPIYNISLKVNGENVDWNGSKDIDITISLDKKYTLEDHKFVAVYFDGKGNFEILESSYYSDGKLRFKTKHLSEYGAMYVDNNYKDIENHWAKESIEALTARKILEGVNEEQFRPDGTISRAEAISILTSYFNFESKSKATIETINQKIFDDIDSSVDYAKAIALCKELNLINGCENNQFRPKDPLTRQDMMVLLSRALTISDSYPNIKKVDKTYEKFEDCKKISPYAKKSVEKMMNCQIVNARKTGLCPKENASRAELANALYNIMKSNMQ